MSKVRLAPPAGLVKNRRQSLASLPKRLFVISYGAVSYTAGVGALVALILILIGVFNFTGGPFGRLGTPAALAVDTSLLIGFALQHSIMARAPFKANWVKVIHPSMERATYVLATGLVLFAVLFFWQPMPSVLWTVNAHILRAGILTVALLGWAYLFAASFAINHFELFGLQQVYRFFRGQEAVAVPFTERWMYKIDRHPIMTGMLIGLWATPTMTAGHFTFALGFSFYVIVGVYFEERALRREWGAAYEQYCERVGTVVPLPWRLKQSAPSVIQAADQ